MITRKHLSALYKIYATTIGLKKPAIPLHKLAIEIDQATPETREQLAQRILERVSSEQSNAPAIDIQYAHLIRNWDTTYTYTRKPDVPTESAEHRLQRARTLFADFQHYIDLVDNTDGQERGRNYRRANSKLAAIKRAVGRIASTANAPRYGATNAQQREAKNLIDTAERMYETAWKRHHK